MEEEEEKNEKDDEAKPIPSAGRYGTCLLGHQGIYTSGFSA
jgi:hypothetical protein